jgi:RNA polymerase sigma-70 factor (ECF subfamily)
MLFQRIMSNATMDWFRRQKVRNAVVQNLSDFEGGDDDDDFDLLESLQSVEGCTGIRKRGRLGVAGTDPACDRSEIAELPARQREAFLLRYWEEFDVAETAEVMGCSEGSVKTHCSRAVHALAKALRAKGITP